MAAKIHRIKLLEFERDELNIRDITGLSIGTHERPRSRNTRPPSHLAREDYEYIREGSVCGIMVAMPDLGKRVVFVGCAGRRTSLEFAACLDHLSNNLLPEAEKIVLVMDNLNTHKEASLYEAFLPDKARALCERFELHYSPTHGSWLNIELQTFYRAGSGAQRRHASVRHYAGPREAPTFVERLARSRRNHTQRCEQHQDESTCSARSMRTRNPAEKSHSEIVTIAFIS